MTTEIESLLKQRLGLDADSIGSSAIARAVQERMSACQSVNTAAYEELLVFSEEELLQLIELVVVPETWFFRDTEAFATMAQYALEKWLPTHPEGMLRLLSLPCSTGEEAYSMAMALLDAGMPPTRFLVEALDVSARALLRAKEAVYGKNSFRSRDLGFRDRYMQATTEGYKMDSAVVRQVHFESGNLIDDCLLPGPESYDVIFCRNLLIYFDRPTQDLTVEKLWRLLKPNGLAFVGPSETALMTSHHFVSLKAPLAFAFRKADAVTREAKTLKALPRPVKAIAPMPPFVQSRPVPRLTPPARALDLDEALRLADLGQLKEASKHCEDYNHAHGPSAKAFYLLGLIRDAAGEPSEAIGFYRKALYLDPHHREALLHLALLLDQQGETEAAKILNARAARIDHKARN